METLTQKIVQFELPDHLGCPPPTEDRNLRRDDVRLLVTAGSEPTYHDVFSSLDRYLKAGDVLVVNTSATVASAFPVGLPGEKQGTLHLSNKLNDHEWLFEIREIRGTKNERWKQGEEGMELRLPGGAKLSLKRRYFKETQMLDLWIGELWTDQNETTWMQEHGHPIKYTQLDQSFPLSYYQTLFSFHPGSAEMPSAGRGFTDSLMRKLIKRGVVFAPILLHTGVSSLEEHEKPYPEYMEIDPVSALLINQAKASGRRVIAVGTTAIRAIESAVNESGEVEAFRGNTELFIDADYKMKVADGLLTGFHEPRASHLNMLQSIAGFDHIERAYQEAIEAKYFWHQFGDLHLILT